MLWGQLYYTYTHTHTHIYIYMYFFGKSYKWSCVSVMYVWTAFVQCIIVFVQFVFVIKEWIVPDGKKHHVIGPQLVFIIQYITSMLLNYSLVVVVVICKSLSNPMWLMIFLYCLKLHGLVKHFAQEHNGSGLWIVLGVTYYKSKTLQ